jgi:hypothetical protein
MSEALPITRFWLVILIDPGSCAIHVCAKWESVLQEIHDAPNTKVVVYYIQAHDVRTPSISDVTNVAVTCAQGGVAVIDSIIVGDISFYKEELDYLHSKRAGRANGSFLQAFLAACERADGENFQLLLPALRAIMTKYPLRAP